MATKLQIYNSCFIKLGAEPVTDTATSNKRNNLLNAIYDTVKAREVRQHPWNFAIKRAELTVDSTVPTWKWGSAFELPSDYLKIKEVRYDYDYAIENGKLVIEDSFATIVTDEAEASSTTTAINATAHEAVVGDVILVNDERRVVASITANTITLSVALSVAPSAADEFIVYRPADVFVEYIADVAETDYTSDFTEGLAYVLAAEICYALVQNRELSNQILEKAEFAKRLARSMDAQEGTPIELMDNDYLNVRL